MDGNLIAFLAILLFIVIMMAIIFDFVVRARARKDADGATLGVGELEERIQRAVEAANEPLRRELREVRQQLERLEPGKPRKQIEGGAVREEGLLA